MGAFGERARAGGSARGWLGQPETSGSFPAPAPPLKAAAPRRIAAARLPPRAGPTDSPGSVFLRRPCRSWSIGPAVPSSSGRCSNRPGSAQHPCRDAGEGLVTISFPNSLSVAPPGCGRGVQRSPGVRVRTGGRLPVSPLRSLASVIHADKYGFLWEPSASGLREERPSMPVFWQ